MILIHEIFRVYESFLSYLQKNEMVNFMWKKYNYTMKNYIILTGILIAIHSPLFLRLNAIHSPLFLRLNAFHSPLYLRLKMVYNISRT